jgi:transposase
LNNTNDRIKSQKKYDLGFILIEFEMKNRNSTGSILKIGEFIKLKCKRMAGSVMQMWKILKKTHYV